MKIEHFAVFVYDLEKTKDFYIKYFGAKAGELYHNKNTGFCSYFLSFEDGSRLEIMTKPNLKSNIIEEHLGYAHLAIKAGSKDKVNSLAQQLQNDGFKILSGPRTTGDGYYECCILDYESNCIEIVE